MNPIDFGSYTRLPRFSASGAVVVTIRLLRAAPKDASPAELEALQDMRDGAEGVQEAVTDRHRTTGSNLRPLDRRFDGSWAGFHGRLFAWTRMYGHPNAQRAEELLAKLFPDGLQFVNAKYESQWFHSRMLLTRIKHDELTADLNELAGEPFLTGVHAAHAAFGEAMGLDENAEPDAGVLAIGEQVALLTDAIADYCRVLSGGVKRKDPDSRARFLAAVAPIDTYRAQNRRSSTSADADPELDDGVDDAEIDANEDADGLDIDSPLPPLPGSEDA
jgi:hypothetical protein